MCGRVAARSNSQRTICPVVIVTSDGWNRWVGESIASIVADGAWADATLAVNRQVQTAATVASSANVVRRMNLSSIPRLPA